MLPVALWNSKALHSPPSTKFEILPGQDPSDAKGPGTVENGRTLTNAPRLVSLNHSTPSWWKFHTLMASLQILFIVAVALGAGLLRSDAHRGVHEELIGHSFIGALLVAAGIFHLVHANQISWHKALVADGKKVIFGAIAYTIVELLTDQYSEDRPFTSFPLWSMHIAFATWFGLVGCMSVMIGNYRAKSLAKLPVLITAISWIIFIGSHAQHSQIGFYAHGVSAVWIALFCIAALMDRNIEAGTCLIYCGYNLFSGQHGLGDWVEQVHFMPAAYLMWWHVIATLVICCYLYQLFQTGSLSIDNSDDDDDHVRDDDIHDDEEEDTLSTAEDQFTYFYDDDAHDAPPNSGRCCCVTYIKDDTFSL